MRSAEFPPDYPYAYVTGKVEFFGLHFRSDPRALVPRLETESLVREAVRILSNGDFRTVVDVGTGSGIIATCLAKRFPELRTVALDLSEKALSLAEENARSNGANVEFVRSDLLSALPFSESDFPALFVANLPYVRTGAEDVSPDTAYEPPEALYGGDRTGFELTDRFLSELEETSRKFPGARILAACEVGDDHAQEIAAASERFGREVRTFADLVGIHRFFTYRIWPDEKA